MIFFLGRRAAGWRSRASSVLSIRPAIWALTESGLFIYRDTDAGETPAMAAILRTVIFMGHHLNLFQKQNRSFIFPNSW